MLTILTFTFYRPFCQCAIVQRAICTVFLPSCSLFVFVHLTFRAGGVLSKLAFSYNYNKTLSAVSTHSYSSTTIQRNKRCMVCVYSKSRNDVFRVDQRYGTIAAHTRRRASVLVVFVVFCVYMHSFAGLIRWTPPPTFSDSAITDRHSDTSIFQLRAHWVQISWSIGSEKSFGRFFRSNRPGYPHLVSSELENSGTIVLDQKNCSNFFFRFNRLGYPHPVRSEMENSGIRVWYTMIAFFFFLDS